MQEKIVEKFEKWWKCLQIWNTMKYGGKKEKKLWINCETVKKCLKRWKTVKIGENCEQQWKKVKDSEKRWTTLKNSFFF